MLPLKSVRDAICDVHLRWTWDLCRVDWGLTVDIRYLIVNQLQIQGRISLSNYNYFSTYFSDLGFINWRNIKTGPHCLLTKLPWCQWRFTRCVLQMVNDPRRCFVVCCWWDFWSVRLITVIGKAIRVVSNTLNQMSAAVTQRWRRFWCCWLEDVEVR